jgi:hypothetical protein
MSMGGVVFQWWPTMCLFSVCWMTGAMSCVLDEHGWGCFSVVANNVFVFCVLDDRRDVLCAG